MIKPMKVAGSNTSIIDQLPDLVVEDLPRSPSLALCSVINKERKKQKKINREDINDDDDDDDRGDCGGVGINLGESSIIILESKQVYQIAVGNGRAAILSLVRSWS